MPPPTPSPPAFTNATDIHHGSDLIMKVLYIAIIFMVFGYAKPHADAKKTGNHIFCGEKWGPHNPHPGSANEISDINNGPEYIMKVLHISLILTI